MKLTAFTGSRRRNPILDSYANELMAIEFSQDSIADEQLPEDGAIGDPKRPSPSKPTNSNTEPRASQHHDSETSVPASGDKIENSQSSTNNRANSSQNSKISTPPPTPPLSDQVRQTRSKMQARTSSRASTPSTSSPARPNSAINLRNREL